MEIKVQCTCGTKFKFDVEPVNGRMPAPVSCPECGADATPQANDFLRQAFASAQPGAIATPVPPASPAGLNVRMNRPAASPTVPSLAPGGYTPPPLPTTAGMRAAVPPAEPASKAPMIGLVIVLVVLLCGVVGLWKFGSKWFGHFQAISEMAGGGSGLSAEEEALRPKNLWFDDCVVLFVKHTNHLNVAEACKDYWKEKLHKDLSLTSGSFFIRRGEHSFDSAADFELKDDEKANVPVPDKPKKTEYGLAPARNGYVRLRGSSEWPAAQFEGLAQYLSQRFNTLVVELNSSFSEEYHFGVYDQGTRVFHARRHGEMINHDYYDIINSDGDDWAIAHGYKAGPDGFKAFRIIDADRITQQLGMKMGEEKNGAEVKFLVLKE